jgi:hypothetical protein
MSGGGLFRSSRIIFDYFIPSRLSVAVLRPGSRATPRHGLWPAKRRGVAFVNRLKEDFFRYLLPVLFPQSHHRPAVLLEGDRFPCEVFVASLHVPSVRTADLREHAKSWRATKIPPMMHLRPRLWTRGHMLSRPTTLVAMRRATSECLPEHRIDGALLRSAWQCGSLLQSNSWSRQR